MPMNVTLRYILSGLLCLISLNAQAIENQAIENQAIEKITIRLDFIPNIEDGKKTFEVCARCHLPEAWGNADGTFPQLAGQHVNVLMKQLLDIRNGTRRSSLMFPFVQERTIGGYQELSNVVAYISTLPMNPAHARGPWHKGSSRYNRGKKTYQKFCARCHGSNGEGNDKLAYPKLQGQHFQYMSRQLQRIKTGLRQVNPAMQAVIKNIDFEQLDEAANYASYFAVPEKDLAPTRLWRNPDFK